jgi:hypothetical protein
LGLAVRHADHIICISKSTEQDLHEFMPDTRGRTSTRRAPRCRPGVCAAAARRARRR